MSHKWNGALIIIRTYGINKRAWLVWKGVAFVFGAAGDGAPRWKEVCGGGEAGHGAA